VVLQPQERTLTDVEIEDFSKRLITQVEKATGGQLTRLTKRAVTGVYGFPLFAAENRAKNRIEATLSQI
jgi:hypothetical protein